MIQDGSREISVPSNTNLSTCSMTARWIVKICWATTDSTWKHTLHSDYFLLLIIGRGWAKYRDLSVASRSIICQRRRLRQKIDARDTGKSRYFAITEFNNCFIIWSPSLFFNDHLRDAKRFAFFRARTIARRRKEWFRLHMSRILFSQTQLDDIAHKQTVICRQLFAGHLVGFRPMKRKKTLHRMIMSDTRPYSPWNLRNY